MREFRKKYTKNFHKIRKQKIMKSRKRSGGGYPSLSLPSLTSLPSLPNFFKNKEKPPLKEYAPSDALSEDNNANTGAIGDIIDSDKSINNVSNDNDANNNDNEKDDSNDYELDDNIAQAEADMKIGNELDTVMKSDVESIEHQANKLFTPETPETWNRENMDFDSYAASISYLNTELNYIRNMHYIAHGYDGYEALEKKVKSLVSFLKDEKRKLKEKKKNIYLKALNEYKEKRKEILVLLKKQPNSMRALFTSSNKLESIIERANANNEITPEKVKELVNKKVEVKKAKNIIDRSKHIINSVTKIYYVIRKKYYEFKEQYDQEMLGRSLFGSEEGGGSKKRNTSKRHTKRHKRNNKKRYTKKTKQAH
jgi:hypothetical protein